MAIINITEFSKQGTDSNLKDVPAPSCVGSKSYTLTTTLTSQQSQELLSSTKIIRVYADEDTWVSFGASPIAVPETSILLVAGSVEYFSTDRATGSALKLAARLV